MILEIMAAAGKLLPMADMPLSYIKIQDNANFAFRKEESIVYWQDRTILEAVWRNLM